MRNNVRFNNLFKVITSLLVYLITRYILIGVLTIVFINLGFGTFNNPFGHGILDSIHIAYAKNMHNNELFLVAWFLIAYMFSVLLCNVIISSIHSITSSQFMIKIIITLIAFTFGILAINYTAVIYHESTNQIYNLITQALYGSMFMLFGYVLKNFVIKFSSLSVLLLITIVLAAITDTFKTTPMIMSWSQYKDGFLLCTLIAMTIISCIFIISNAFEKITNEKSTLIYIGKNTKSIMTWHLCIFILIDVIMSQTLKNRPLNSYAVFEHFHNEYSIAIYVICGVMIPIVLLYLKSLMKAFLLSKWFKKSY